jgi:hypothetical protein
MQQYVILFGKMLQHIGYRLRHHFFNIPGIFHLRIGPDDEAMFVIAHR